MYYLDEKTSGMGQADHVSAGITAAGVLLPTVAALFSKKPKEQTGPTRAQLEMMYRQAEAERQDKYIKYGLIFAGVLALGFVAYKISKKRRK